MQIAKIKSVKTLAKVLGLPVLHLVAICDAIDMSYRTKLERKPDGGTRELTIPNPHLMRVQRMICEAFQALETSQISHGGVRGRKVATAALPHVSQQIVASIDILRFFDSISHSQVYRSLEGCTECSPPVLRILTRLVTFRGALPQGAPTSPIVSNIVLLQFDADISAFAEQHECRATRFIDDIFISGEAGAATIVYEHVICMLHRNSFRVNRGKLRIAKSGGPQSLLGLNVNTKLSIPRKSASRLSRDGLRSVLRATIKSGSVEEKERQRRIGQIRHVAAYHPGWESTREVVRFMALPVRDS